MKFFLISDNLDTQMGMRIAGIEGVVAHTEKEVNEALDEAVSDEEIAVVLMTQKTAGLCAERVYDIKITEYLKLNLQADRLWLKFPTDTARAA